jgi:D-3-phosphoglycerate dehydrogenase
MKVVAYDPFVPADAIKGAGCEPATLDEIAAKSDVISLHVGLSDETRGMVNAAFLAKCKKGVRILNVARGGLIDDDALIAAMDSGHVAGAGIDVWSVEPPTDLRVVKHPKVLPTPHLGASTGEAQERVSFDVVDAVRRFFIESTVVNSVNAAQMKPGVQR